MSEELFSVYQMFSEKAGGMTEKVRELVPAQQAIEAFAHYTNSVGAKLGIVERVIVTDGGDCTNVEWRYGKGYTYDGEHYAPTAHTSAHPNVKR
jgi:hypothetical protein